MDDFIVELTGQAVRITILLASPMLLGALFVGILISLFQAVTQINEQTLAFIPKILVIIGALVIFSPWMKDTITDYTRDLIVRIPKIVATK